MTITAQAIKELRERTGVGMAKCKDALEKAGGDIEEAITILRKSGMASAVKKEGRETKEGVVISFETATHIGIAEVNAETDFVVKNEKFQTFAKDVAEEIAKTHPASLEVFMQQKYSKDPSLSIDQLRSLQIQTIGENIQISRIACIKKDPNHSVAIYSHMGGKILTLVEVSLKNQEVPAKDVAMHVAACSPEYCEPKDIPENIIEQEREIAKEQVKDRPPEVTQKIVQGKLEKFFEKSCLSRQPFVKDSSVTVENFLKNANPELKLVRFIRWGIGQA